MLLINLIDKLNVLYCLNKTEKRNYKLSKLRFYVNKPYVVHNCVFVCVLLLLIPLPGRRYYPHVHNMVASAGFLPASSMQRPEDGSYSR